MRVKGLGYLATRFMAGWWLGGNKTKRRKQYLDCWKGWHGEMPFRTWRLRMPEDLEAAWPAE